jgi:restriction system protein
MGYDDVEVTKQSGDKGVDVAATVQFGITSVKEVVQVKRYKGNVQRSQVDELRGALYHHNAIQGTMLTTSGFSSGAKDAALLPGAPPISLIDGERLLDLLIEHEIGIQKKPAVMYEVDGQYFD